jgi:uncharacterized membrane protein
MFELIRGAALVAATITMGLMAGLFFAFTMAVMPGLARASDRSFVEGMQRINESILNGWFALAFGGALVFTAIAAALHLRADGRPALPWIVAALVLYAVQLVITIRINVPLNDALLAAGAVDGITDLGAVRERFEARWLRWNHVRTLLSTGALGCLAWALVTYGRVVL